MFLCEVVLRDSGADRVCVCGGMAVVHALSLVLVYMFTYIKFFSSFFQGA